MKKKDILSVQLQLKQSRKIVIVSHYNPDGDAVGSSLGLYHFFKNEGYETSVILPNTFPNFLTWIPGSGEAIIADKEKAKAKEVILNADMLFVVDMNSASRGGKVIEQEIRRSKAYKVLIDHHLSPDIEVDVMYSKIKTSSTCELVYRFIFDYLKYKNKLTYDIARCLYVGIITDTGSLTYSCNDPVTYTILSKLIKAGVNGEEVHRLIYDNYSESRIHLLGLCLSQRLEVLPEFATAFIHLSKKDLDDYNYQIGDTEGFVNYGLSMRSVQFAAIFIQREDKIRISFRSKGNFDVNQFARIHFNGGGHRNASAAYHTDTIENTIQYFKSILPQYKEELLKPYQKGE